MQDLTPFEVQRAAEAAGVTLPRFDVQHPTFRVIQAAWRSRHSARHRAEWDVEDFIRWVTTKPVGVQKALDRLHRLYIRQPFKSDRDIAREKREADNDAAWKALETTSRMVRTRGPFPGANMVEVPLEPLMEVAGDARYAFIGLECPLKDAYTLWVPRRLLVETFASLARRRSLYNVEIAVAVETPNSVGTILCIRWMSKVDWRPCRGGLTFRGTRAVEVFKTSWNTATLAQAENKVEAIAI